VGEGGQIFTANWLVRRCFMLFLLFTVKVSAAPCRNFGVWAFKCMGTARGTKNSG
jgi:hypothetical protein